MSIDLSDDILQDFLVEAGELLEQLNEQLVDLERDPDDKDLLNAVFRAFHTVKGGAGFVNLVNMVTLCHRAEDVFNLLRNGELRINADLMDAVLKSLDTLNNMFDEVRAGQEPEPADPALLAQLETFLDPNAAAAQSTPSVAEPVVETTAEAEPAAAGTSTASGDITDEEFEELLQAVNTDAKPAGAAAPVAAAAASDSDAADPEGEITEDEFEALLDQLHGQGKAPSVKAETPASAPSAGGSDAEPESDTISEDEFEDLLDQLYGQGKAPNAGAATPADKKPAEAPKPAAPKLETVKSSPAPAPAKEKAAPANPPPQVEASVRVDTRRLDDLMNLVGELVLVRNRLATLHASVADEAIAKSVANLDQVTSDIQTAVMKTRMQPIKKVFGRFPRVVRDLARNLKKEVELELIGEETDLDKNLVEALADPLVHLVRNSVDHGVEDPEERAKAGKPRVGRVVLAAKQAGDHILITIEDDGKGMDADVLRRKAVEKDLMSADQASRMTDQEAYAIIFMPGFSTKEQISDVSGRGVGMDVVKTRIGQLNGSVEIDSKKGVGTTISIKLPLTLAILPTLMVVVGERRFAIPLANVIETYDLDLSRTNVIDDQEVLVIRGKAVPLFYLRRWLAPNAGGSRRDGMNHVVAVQVGAQRVCFVVDELIGQEEVVIKPLGHFLHGMPGFAGATITGDGRIALILDVPGLLRARVRQAIAA